MNPTSAPSEFASEGEKRPTLRLIAKEAGVTHATVSMALRNHPTISLATRRNIQRLARKLGYRPDPEVAKLMHHLRLKHKPLFKSMIAAVTTLTESAEPPYARMLREGARSAAEALGYGFEVFRVTSADKRDPCLQRILRSRGIEGVIILPLREATSVRRLLDWKEFSVVAATYGVLDPDFRRVIPDQFGNMMLICRQLAKLRRRRIGLVMQRRTDLVVDHRFSAAVMWHNTIGGAEFVRAYLYQDDYRPGLKTWFAAEQPDSLIVPGEEDARAIAAELGLQGSSEVRIVLADRPAPAPFGGIDQRPGEIGAAAVGQLHALIQRGEKGAPQVPSATLINGQWRPAPARGR